MNGHDNPELFEPTDDERRRDEDDEAEGDEPFPYSFDEWNAILANTGRNPVTFSEYVSGYLAEHSERMDFLFWPSLVYFGAVDELGSNGDNHV
jgi:hypothetical protein